MRSTPADEGVPQNGLGAGEPDAEKGETKPSRAALNRHATTNFKAELERHKKQNARCLIDPRNSNFLRRWDLVVAICLIYTALAAPYEVGFLPSPESALSVLFIINRVIDVVFLFDMIKEFFVMYEEDSGTALTESGSQGATTQAKTRAGSRTNSNMVSDHRRIAKHYLLTWFIIDLVSVLTFVFDIISITRDAGDTQDVSKLRLFKILRVLRLIKLVRLLKSSRLFERWQASIDLDFSSQTVIKCLFMYLICGHWFACILVLSASFSYPMHSWKGSKGYCVSLHDADGLKALGQPPVQDQLQDLMVQLPVGYNWVLQDTSTYEPYVYGADEHFVFCVVPSEMWMASYYWMIMLISGASGGDTDRNYMYPHEQLVFTGLVVASALLWSQIIASFCDVLSNLNPEHAAFRQRMDNLNRYCRSARFDSHTRHRLREYLYRAKHVQVEESQRELMLLMSPKLQGELSLQVNGTWLTTVRFLQNIEAACCVEIALALVPAVFVPTEIMDSSCLYYLQRGTIVNQGIVLVGGDHWGKDCILEREDLRSRPARALSYAEVSSLHRDKLISIINQETVTRDGSHTFIKYPKALRMIKWEAVRIAIIRMLYFLSAADDVDPDNKSSPGEPQVAASVMRKHAGAWGAAFLKMGNTEQTMEDLERVKEEQKQIESAKRSAFKRSPTYWSKGPAAAGPPVADTKVSPDKPSSSSNAPAPAADQRSKVSFAASSSSPNIIEAAKVEVTIDPAPIPRRSGGGDGSTLAPTAPASSSAAPGSSAPLVAATTVAAKSTACASADDPSPQRRRKHRSSSSKSLKPAAEDDK